MFEWVDFVFLFLASFRLTRLIVYDKITSFIRRPFHEIIKEEQADGTIQQFLRIKGTGLRAWIGELLSCYWCTGMWCAAFFYFGYIYWPIETEPLIIIFAIAGCAAIIEVIVERIMN